MWRSCCLPVRGCLRDGFECFWQIEGAGEGGGGVLGGLGREGGISVEVGVVEGGWMM